ncbi:hypothetical protein FKM82_013912 [Ascaphus truei]
MHTLNLTQKYNVCDAGQQDHPISDIRKMQSVMTGMPLSPNILQMNDHQTIIYQLNISEDSFFSMSRMTLCHKFCVSFILKR